jgi:hypothetical protein
MKFALLTVAWCILFVLRWPIALLLIVAAPFIWLVALPFRLAGVCIAALFALVRSVLFLPARLLGYRG